MWLGVTAGVLVALFVVSRIVRAGLRLVFRLAMIAFVVLVVAGTATCWNSPDSEQVEDADYAVLLGCALENGQPKEEMIRRMQLGLDWLADTKDTVLMLTGGDPGDQGVTEAQVMYDWLQANGADMSRVVMEDQAADTRQNLLFCRELAEQLGLASDRVLILSSEYHQTRAQYLARQLGQQALGLSCKTPFLDHVTASVREVYSFAKAFLETR